ncbi:MAG: hypothetical protein HDR00_13260 [Lachnospiraceae bacterium]|nr:hypothetical protein [Lachnospiraceae bacterium]
MNRLSLYEPADIEIYIKDKGIVLREKSLIAIGTEGKLPKILAVGNEVEKINPISNNIVILSPLHQGTIDDFITAEKMFAYFFKKAIKHNFLKSPSISLCIPFQIDNINLKAYQDAIYMSGKAKKVKFIFKSLEEFLQTASPEELEEHKIILNITKDSPIEYVRERVKETIKYASQYGITKDQLLDIMKEL